jgi:hypothetical protein
MSFWQRTLKIFRAAPVRIVYRGGALGARTEVIGEIEGIGDTSFTLRKADGATLLIPFQDLLVVDPVVTKL